MTKTFSLKKHDSKSEKREVKQKKSMIYSISIAWNNEYCRLKQTLVITLLQIKSHPRV